MFIEFGEIKIQLLILLIYPIGIISSRIGTYYYSNNPYFYLFLFYLSHYLILIIKLFYKIKELFSKNKKSEIENKLDIDESTHQIVVNNVKNEIVSLKSRLEKGKNKEKILRIIFIGILYFITYFFFYYSNFITTTNFYGNISMISEILYFSLLNKILFGDKIYIHHLFSMIIITVSILCLYILLIFSFIANNDWDIWRDILIPTIINFIVYFIFCFDLIIAKFYIEKYFISPYILLFSLGTIGLILLFIFEPFTFLIHCNDPIICYEGHFGGIISGFKQITSPKDIIITIIWLLGLFMTAIGLWLTVRNLTPSHFLTSDSLITFGLNIVFDCYNVNIELLKNPLFYILSILTIFGCLIYNEIIIIKLFGLNYNTRIEIIERNLKDIEQNDLIPECKLVSDESG